jgi:hypothetical protein
MLVFGWHNAARLSIALLQSRNTKRVVLVCLVSAAAGIALTGGFPGGTPAASAASLVTYSGVVANSAGTPVSDLTVGLGSNSAMTGSQGQFSVSVQPGTYTLSLQGGAQFSGYAIPFIDQFSGPAVSVTSDTVQDLTIPTIELTVDVQDTAGNPVQGATVSYPDENSAIDLFPGSGPATVSSSPGQDGYAASTTGTDGSTTVVALPGTFSAPLTVNFPDGHTQTLNPGTLTTDTTLTVTETGAADATVTVVSCTPDPVAAGSGSSCTAIVTDTSSSPVTPAGTITFTSTGSGTFTGSGSCTLAGSGASASCQLTYTQAANGQAMISASYGGDGQHAGSSDTTALTIYQPLNGDSTCTGIDGGTGRNVTVPAGATCTLIPGTVITRDLTDDGTLTMSGVTVDRSLQADDAGPLIITGPSAVIGGDLLWLDNSAPVTIGGPGCAGNTVSGNLQAQDNTMPRAIPARPPRSRTTPSRTTWKPRTTLLPRSCPGTPSAG